MRRCFGFTFGNDSSDIISIFNEAKYYLKIEEFCLTEIKCCLNHTTKKSKKIAVQNAFPSMLLQLN